MSDDITKKLPKNEILTKGDVRYFCSLFADAFKNYESFPGPGTLDALNRCSELLERAQLLAISQGLSPSIFGEILKDELGF